MNDDLISRAALKEALKSNCKPELCHDYGTNWCEACCPHNDFEDLIDNAPTVAVNCKDCDGYEAGYSAGLKDAERPRDIFPMEIVMGKCPIEAGGDCPLKSQSEWIPVSERLPNRNGCYIVTRIVEETPLSDVCYFDGQNTWHSDNRVNHGRPYLTDVIAWQPLPEPYKEGGAE